MLDRLYRDRFGAEIYDTLLESGIHLNIMLADSARGGLHVAYGRMGGWPEWGDSPASRCLVGTGKTPQEAMTALVTGSCRIYHVPNVKTSLWALGEAMELLAGAMGQNRQHEYFECEQPCEKQHCVYCEGGLAYCVKCKQGEAELEDFCRGS